MAVKLKWRVPPAPTGRYRSFHRRGWPSADLSDGRAAVRIECKDDYVPLRVREGNHGELTVYVAKWFKREGLSDSFNWLRLKTRVNTLDEAKALAQRFADSKAEEMGWI